MPFRPPCFAWASGWSASSPALPGQLQSNSGGRPEPCGQRQQGLVMGDTDLLHEVIPKSPQMLVPCKCCSGGRGQGGEEGTHWRTSASLCLCFCWALRCCSASIFWSMVSVRVTSQALRIATTLSREATLRGIAEGHILRRSQARLVFLTTKDDRGYSFWGAEDLYYAQGLALSSTAFGQSPTHPLTHMGRI